jgi:hypothetical protein
MRRDWLLDKHNGKKLTYNNANNIAPLKKQEKDPESIYAALQKS